MPTIRAYISKLRQETRARLRHVRFGIYGNCVGVHFLCHLLVTAPMRNPTDAAIVESQGAYIVQSLIDEERFPIHFFRQSEFGLLP